MNPACAMLIFMNLLQVSLREDSGRNKKFLKYLLTNKLWTALLDYMINFINFFLVSWKPFLDPQNLAQITFEWAYFFQKSKFVQLFILFKPLILHLKIPYNHWMDCALNILFCLVYLKFTWILSTIFYICIFSHYLICEIF